MKYNIDNGKNGETLVQEIERIFFEVVSRHQTDMEEEKNWLFSNCSDPQLSEIVSNLSIITFHVLDAIGRFQPVNSITISKMTEIPKGTVSKNIKKLLTEGLIVKQALPDNKKESVFFLTSIGKSLFALHKEVHAQFDSKLSVFLQKYDTEELQFLVRFLKDFQTVNWTGNDTDSIL